MAVILSNGNHMELSDTYLQGMEKNGSGNERDIARTLRQAAEASGDEGRGKAITTNPLRYFKNEGDLGGSFPAAMGRAAHAGLTVTDSGYSYPGDVETCVKAGTVSLEAITNHRGASDSEKILASTALEVSKLFTDSGRPKWAYDACLCSLGLMDNRDREHYSTVFEPSKTIHDLRPDGVLAAFGQMMSNLGDEPVNRQAAKLILDEIAVHGKGRKNRAMAKTVDNNYRGVFKTIFEAENGRTSGLREIARETKEGIKDAGYGVRDWFYEHTT